MSDTKGDGFGKEVPEFGPRPGSRRFGAKAQTPAPADFKKWARCDSWHIAEGAMLILGFEPFDVHGHFWPEPAAPGFDDIFKTALRSDGFTAQGHWVSPRHFLAWAREKAYPVPSKLEKAVNRFHPKAEGSPQGGEGTGGQQKLDSSSTVVAESIGKTSGESMTGLV